MKAGETKGAATTKAAPQQPRGRRSRGHPPAAHADGADAAVQKSAGPRGRFFKESRQEAVVVESLANGTAESKHKPTQTADPARGRAMAKQRVRGKPTGEQQQRVQGAKKQEIASKKTLAAARAAVEAAYGHNAQRKRKRPARLASPSSDGETDDEGEDTGSEAEGDDDQHHSSSGSEHADGAPNADVDSDDSKAGSGSESNSSSSSDSDSDSQSEKQKAVTAARKHLAAAGGKAAAKQSQQCQRQPNPAPQDITRQHKPAAKHASSNKRKQKGPLARLRIAAAAPASTTTTTNSTQLLGGAARPIPEVTSYHQAVRRVNHQIQRISTEEHLLQTYTADGWKGASKEKVRLTDDLKRAEQTLARCKESIRQAYRYCEEVHPGPPIPPAAYDSDGEVDVSDIFCAKCLKKESSDDNDLVLCDGTCNRAYHECCLNPRLVAADLPEDEGWLCPACDAKMDILIQINAYYNTEYELDISWQDLFNESPEQQQAMQLQRLRSGDLLSPRAGKAAAAAAGGWLAHEFPSEDEEDNSYSQSDHDEVVGKHRPKKRRRPSSNHRATNDAAAAAGGDSSSSGDSAGSGDGVSGSGGSGSDDEAVSLHSEGGTQLSEGDAAAPQDPPLRRSKRSTAADGVYAAALAAGASPRNVGASSRLKGVRVDAGKSASAAAAAAGENASKHAGRLKSAAAADVDASGKEGSADEQQQLKRRRSSGGSKHRRRGGSKVDYKQLHEKLFGFAAFDGDDDVFREDSDDDYETDTHSDASD